MDVENPKNLQKLINLCRKNGVRSLKMGDLQIELAPESLFPRSAYKQKKLSTESSSALESIPTDNTYSEEDALFWSSAGLTEGAEGTH